MAHRTTDYRRKQKLEDPEKYQLYLQKSKERNKKNREKLKHELQKKKPDKDDIEKKKRLLELQRQRQKIYSEKKKKEKLIVNLTDSFYKLKTSQKKNKQNKPQTRNNVSSKREYNRIKKQEERQRQSYQKQMWIRKKDRERKMQKRATCNLKAAKAHNTSLPSTPVPEPKAGFRSKKTEWNVTSQVRTKLPETPQKFAKVVHNLMQNATPRKRKALEELRSERKKSKLTIRAEWRHPRFKTSQTRVAASLIKRSLKKRKSRVDSIGIEKFYLREDISQVLPNKRFATKEGPGYIMQVPVSSAHSKYVSENPAKRVSLGKFASLRKKNVRLLTKVHRNYCCCVFCMNVRFKLLTLSRAMPDTTKKKTNEGDLLDIALCSKGDNERFHQPSCINGSCEKCGDYMKTISEFYSNIGNKELNWNRWEKVKGQDGKEKRIVVTRRGKKEDLFMELVASDIKKPAQGITFFKHYFNAQWQTLQFKQTKKDLPDDTVLQVLDFAKNREIKYQDEIKATYYTASQVTLHPIVNFYKTVQGLVRESCVVISEDPKHDYHAVQHYQGIVKRHICQQTQHPPTRYIVFSDGCSSQYKSKGPFADLASETIDVNRNFFGSEHGKSECDGEIGVINQAIDRAIIGNKVIINNAEDMYNFCKNHLEMNEVLTKRNFFFVKENEIDRNRPETYIKTIPNTRQFHQIINMKSQKLCLKVRGLSCFCKMCESGNGDQCLNAKFVGPYELKQLRHEGKTEYVHKETETTKSEASDREHRKPDMTDNNSGSEFVHRNESTTSDEEQRSNFFTSKLLSFTRCHCYHDLEGEVKEAYKDVLKTFGEIDVKKDVNILDQHLIGDAATQGMMQSAPNYLPNDLQGRLPINVIGDGNCLPRSGSVLAFGSEERYTEIRCRIVIELVRNKSTYLKLGHMNQDIDITSNEARDLLKTYCMFSEKYIPGTRTTRSTIVNVYEQEVMSICQDKTFMGIWQIFALSSLLHCRLFSVYPDLGSYLYRTTLNRTVPPIENRHNGYLAGVVWTSTRNDMRKSNWVPNHFVPLIPVSKPEDVEVVDMFDDIEIMDTSLDSSIVDGILRSLKDSPFSETLTAGNDSVRLRDEVSYDAGIASLDEEIDGETREELEHPPASMSCDNPPDEVSRPVSIGRPDEHVDEHVDGHVVDESHEELVQPFVSMSRDSPTDEVPRPSRFGRPDEHVDEQVDDEAHEELEQPSASMSCDSPPDEVPRPASIVHPDEHVDEQVDDESHEELLQPSASMSCDSPADEVVPRPASIGRPDEHVDEQVDDESHEELLQPSANMSCDNPPDEVPRPASIVHPDEHVDEQVDDESHEELLQPSANMSCDNPTDEVPRPASICRPDEHLDEQVDDDTHAELVQPSASMSCDSPPDEVPLPTSIGRPDEHVDEQVDDESHEELVQPSASMSCDNPPDEVPLPTSIGRPDEHVDEQVDDESHEEIVQPSASMSCDNPPDEVPLPTSIGRPDEHVDEQVDDESHEELVQPSASMSCDNPPDEVPLPASIGRPDEHVDEQVDDEDHEDPVQPSASMPCDRFGDYILVRHGMSLLPAVVDNWPWIKFFNKGKKKGFWVLNEIRHTVLPDDVDHIIPPPDIIMCGTRIMYHFPEHSQKKKKQLTRPSMQLH